MTALLLLSGCESDAPTSAIDRLNFNDPKSFRAEVLKLIPLRASRSDVRKLLPSKRLKLEYEEQRPEGYVETFTEASPTRLRNMLYVGYDERMVTVIYRNGRVAIRVGL